jgi:4-carboxymuconolactone decarboxylase
MPNITLMTAETAPLTAKPYFGSGDVSPIVASLAQVPEFLSVGLPFIGTVFGDSSISERLKEIVVLRASANNRCRYCIDAHTVVAREAGLSPAETASLRLEAPLPDSFDAREGAVVAFTDALCDRPAEAVAHLRPFFEEYQIVELVTVGSLTIMLNKYATSLGLPTSAATNAFLLREGLVPA